jgi:hypothetical protein
LQHRPNHSMLHIMLAGIAWSQNDSATMEKELGLAQAGGPEGEFSVASVRMNLAAYHGRLQESHALYQKLAVMAQKANLPEAASSALAAQAVWEAVYGLKTQAVQTANEALQSSDSPGVAQMASVTYALCGDDKRAQQITNALASKRPYDTLVQNVHVPWLNALVELNHDQAAKAMDLLDTASLYARASVGVLYTRGVISLQADKAVDAAQAFQRVIDLRSLNLGDPAISFASLGMARAYAREGDVVKSKIAYQDVLALWKDADPDLPLAKQARDEYLRLQ